MADDFARQLLDALYNPEPQPAQPQQPQQRRIAQIYDPERLRRLGGIGEAAMTFGSGLLGSVPAGLAGMAELIPTRGRAPDVNRAAQRVEDVQGALTYMPRGETGQRVLQKAVAPLEMLGAPAEYIGEKTLQYTGSPAAATAANVLLDPVNFIGMPGSGKATVAGTKALGRAAAAAPRIAGEMAQDLLMGQGRMEGQRGAIRLSGRKQEKSVYPQEEALERARKNAVEMLGLPENNTPEMRAQAMGYIDYLHGTERMDRLLEGKTLDPRRATSGPMPYGTTTPELASSYATSKADTSRRAADEGDIRRYFEVSPKDIGLKGLRSPIPVEMAWHFMSPEQKAKIRELAPRVGYEDLDTFTGKFVVHPEGVNATLNPSHWDWIMKNEAKGNPLTALREMWYSSGQLVDEPETLGQIFRLAGVDAPISQTKAPWTEAQGVLLGKARITNPIDTSNTEQVAALIEPLKQAFAKDRTKTKTGGPDQWAKESRYTPKTWVSELEKDLAEGKESYVWTSIPDKVTAELKKLGFNGIIDRSGKGGGAKEPVVIPFEPSQIRSRFAAFDPAEMDKPDLLKKTGGSVHISDNPDTMQLELAKGGGVGEKRDLASKIAGGGIRGVITRGLLGMDPPEDMTPGEREIYENMARASAPAQGLGVGKAIFLGAKGAQKAAKTAVSEADRLKFAELASSGKMHMAKSEQQEIDDLLKGASKFAELRLNWEDPKTYDMVSKLEKKGYKTQVFTGRPDAPTYIFKEPKDIENVLRAQTPYEFGKAYGYSDADIAKFYLQRRGGMEDIAAQDWLRDSQGSRLITPPSPEQTARLSALRERLAPQAEVTKKIMDENLEKPLGEIEKGGLLKALKEMPKKRGGSVKITDNLDTMRLAVQKRK